MGGTDRTVGARNPDVTLAVDVMEAPRPHTVLPPHTVLLPRTVLPHHTVLPPLAALLPHVVHLVVTQEGVQVEMIGARGISTDLTVEATVGLTETVGPATLATIGVVPERAVMVRLVVSPTATITSFPHLRVLRNCRVHHLPR